MSDIFVHCGHFRYDDEIEHWVIVTGEGENETWCEPQDEDPRYVADLIDRLCDLVIELRDKGEE